MLMRATYPFAAALILAGCGASASSPSTAAGSGSASPSAARTSAASSAPASTSPASTSASAAGSTSAAPIKVGVLETLTGSLAELGKDNQQGFDLYLSSVNNTMAGRKIEPIFVDDGGKADVGLTKAKQLVENDKVQLLMGGVNSPVCNGVADYVKQAQVPFIVSGSCGDQTLLINPKLKSPYMVRTTQNNVAIEDPAADWAYKHGYRKAILLMSNYNAGIDTGSAFANTFVQRGGSIVQELYPAIGTADFGPYLAQINHGADILVVYLPGADALRFVNQYSDYAGSKIQIIDALGALTTGTNLEQLKDKAVGIIGTFIYATGINTPQNQSFMKAFSEKNNGRPVSEIAVTGYDGAHFLQAALDKVNGKIEDKQQFLQALYSTQIDGARGPVKVDQDHDVVQNLYIYQVVKHGNSFDQQVIATYNDVSKNRAMSDAQLLQFPFEQLKGKWVGMTPAKLAQASKG